MILRVVLIALGLSGFAILGGGLWRGFLSSCLRLGALGSDRLWLAWSLLNGSIVSLLYSRLFLLVDHLLRLVGLVLFFRSLLSFTRFRGIRGRGGLLLILLLIIWACRSLAFLSLVSGSFIWLIG